MTREIERAEEPKLVTILDKIAVLYGQELNYRVFDTQADPVGLLSVWNTGCLREIWTLLRLLL